MGSKDLPSQDSSKTFIRTASQVDDLLLQLHWYSSLCLATQTYMVSHGSIAVAMLGGKKGMQCTMKVV